MFENEALAMIGNVNDVNLLKLAWKNSSELIFGGFMPFGTTVWRCERQARLEKQFVV